MDLHSGTLYWPSVSPAVPPPEPLAPEVACDVLIVGAGVTGAMAAHHLASLGARVCVVDRRPLMLGSTPASTALLLYEIDSPLTRLASRLGVDHAEGAYRASRDAVESVRPLIESLDDDCALAERRSVHYAPDEPAMEDLAREAEARRRAGLDSRLVGRAELLDTVGIDRPGALLNTPAFEVNPQRLTAALLRSAARRGAIIAERTAVEISPALEGTGRVRVPTSAGGWIETQWVVVATGYETPAQCAPVARLANLVSTFAMATRAQPGVEPWRDHALLWEAADPYLYLRTTADERVIIGGGDEPFADAAARDALLPIKTQRLIERLRDLAPHVDPAPAFAWAGTFATTDDGLPFIGPFPGWPRTFFALGYGGNGITFSLLAAQILRDLVAGVASPHARLFGFDRAPE